jgi:uncharacterized protein (TIGR02147 family)
MALKSKSSSQSSSVASESSQKISHFLLRAIADVQKRNKSHSLRALAKRLEISPSYLSKIVNGQKRLPPNLLTRMSSVLNLDHIMLRELQSLMVAEIESAVLQPQTGMSARIEERNPGLKYYATLNAKEFWLLEKWYYIAILNLATTHDFNADPVVIGTRLGITVQSAREGLGLLIAHGYLVKDQDGKMNRSAVKIRFPTQQSHAMIRSYHATHLRKAALLLDHANAGQTFNERLISGISFAGDRRRLENAKAMVHEALYKAAEYLASGDCNEVYHLAIQLFPVSRKGEDD